MKRVRAAVVFVLLNLGFTQIGWGAAYTLRGADEGKAKEGRRLFLDASIALGEGRFGDAYVIAEKLVAEHVGDCQSGLYLRLYANAFYLLDEEYREGGVRPVDTPLPEGIRTRIETLMGKQDSGGRQTDMWERLSREIPEGDFGSISRQCVGRMGSDGTWDGTDFSIKGRDDAEGALRTAVQLREELSGGASG